MSKGFCMIWPVPAYPSPYPSLPCCAPSRGSLVPLLSTLFIIPRGWRCGLSTDQKGLPRPPVQRQLPTVTSYYRGLIFSFTDLITTCNYFTGLLVCLADELHKLFCSPSYPRDPHSFSLILQK